MKIIKKKIDDIERCYSVGAVKCDGEYKVLFASEQVDGPCYSYNLDGTNKEVVWEKGGGTMSIVPIPGKNGEFLATQKFFPGFNANDAKVVHCKYINGKWEVEDYIQIPYLHRFDLLKSGNKIYFIGASLCTSKKDRNDWSDPGKIYGFEYFGEKNDIDKIEVIQENLVKNHGYWKISGEDIDRSLISTEEGVFKVTPPQINNNWEVEHILKSPTSDIAFLENGNIEEIATIEDFHGNDFYIYKKINGNYEKIYKSEGEMVFIHALWAGKILGEESFLVGFRREEAKLKLIKEKDDGFEEIIIDEGKGPSNIFIINQDDKDYIFAANNTVHQAWSYILEK